MTRHRSRRRAVYSQRSHDVETRPQRDPVYRCPSGHLVFGRVRADSLFGYCAACGWHMIMTLATDPEAQRWAQLRANQQAAGASDLLPAADVTVGSPSGGPGQPVTTQPAAAPSPSGQEPPPADPFYPQGTDW